MVNKAQQEGFSLLENVVNTSKVFLQEFGEFYPFAVFLNSEYQVLPFGIANLGEHPKPDALLNVLDNALKGKLHAGAIGGYCIGINVRAVIPGTSGIVDAVEIRLAHSDLDPMTYYMKYEGSGEQMRFYELVAMR